MHLNYKHPQSSLQPVGGNNKSIAVVAVMATLFAAILIVSLGLDQIESTALLVLVIGGLTALTAPSGSSSRSSISQSWATCAATSSSRRARWTKIRSCSSAR